MEADELIAVWRALLINPNARWALFENGTCVVVTDDTAEDIAAYARDLLAEWGPVHAGTSSGDFNIVTLQDAPGWVVTCHHPDILTYVNPDDLAEDWTELSVGLQGRSKRDHDAETLRIIHTQS